MSSTDNPGVNDERINMDSRGLYAKYRVERIDGQDQPHGKHHGCRLFILDPKHDQAARHAIAAYVAVAGERRPELVADLRAWLDALSDEDEREMAARPNPQAAERDR